MVFRSVRLSLDGPNGSVIFVDVRPSPGKAFRGHLRGSTPTSTSYDSYGCLLEIYHSPTFNIQHSTFTTNPLLHCLVHSWRSPARYELPCQVKYIFTARISRQRSLDSQQIGHATHAFLMPPSNGARKGGEKKNDRALFDSVRACLLFFRTS
jgi:hypothetical protein